MDTLITKTTGYLKKNCTKHRHVCTHGNTFNIVIRNLGMNVSNPDDLLNFLNGKFVSSVRAKSVNV